MTFSEDLENCGSDATFFRAVSFSIVGAIVVGALSYSVSKEDSASGPAVPSQKSSEKTKKKRVI